MPIAFKVQNNPWPLPQVDNHSMAWRTQVRAKEGLQKEAVVFNHAGRAWRMMSDEGVQLGGAELAPCPLEFFTAGMLFSLMAEILRHAAAHHIGLELLKILQDSNYSISGSAIRGNMLGAARPAEVWIHIQADAPAADIRRILELAQATCPAHALMGHTLANTFSLTRNGQPVQLTQVHQSQAAPVADPLAQFDSIYDDAVINFPQELVAKVETDEETFCKEREALNNVQIEQRGAIYVHGEAELVNDNLFKAVVQQCKPVVSAFSFLCGPDGSAAPAPLAYLLVGAATCYITQLMRYAHITKQTFQSMSISQDNIFVPDGVASVMVKPVDTRVFMQTDEPESVAQKTVSMAERMCFVHAAMRESHPTIFQATLNGQPLTQ